MMSDHPMLDALAAKLDALDGRTIRVTVEPDAPSARQIDKIHEGLLKKQRQSGTLGLNR